MKHPDETLDFLEQQIPALSASAVIVAYWAALSAGQSVLQTEDDAIVEVFPDGTRRVVKAIEPSVPTTTGTLRWLR